MTIYLALVFVQKWPPTPRSMLVDMTKLVKPELINIDCRGGGGGC